MANGRPTFASEGTGRLSDPFPFFFEPPIKLELDDAERRQQRVASLIVDRVVPRLLALHGSIQHILQPVPIHAGTTEVTELGRLILGPDNADAFNYLTGLREAGLSIDNLYLELLEPTARYLGELWDEDKVDFLDVSIGLVRLQRLVRAFAGLDDEAPYDEKCRALILTTPDEQHNLGNTIVQRFFRAAGWHVCSGLVSEVSTLGDIVAQEWFGVVGLSISADNHLASLRRSIEIVRRRSMNKEVGVIVGGPVFKGRPELSLEIGADGTAINAPTAVILAKKLLLPSLLTSASLPLS